MAKQSELRKWKKRIDNNYVAWDGDELFKFIEKINNQLLASRQKVEQLEKNNKDLVHKLKEKDADIEKLHEYYDLEHEDRRFEP